MPFGQIHGILRGNPPQGIAGLLRNYSPPSSPNKVQQESHDVIPARWAPEEQL